MKARIRQILREGYFSDQDQDRIEILDGVDDMVHVIVISQKLSGQGMREKQDLIMSDLINSLASGEWERVSLAVGASPDEVEGLELDEIMSL